MSIQLGRVKSGVPLAVDGVGRRPGDARTHAMPFPARRSGGQAMLAITVTHNDVELALRLLKRQLQKSGLLRELRRRRQYENPSERRRRRMREGIRKTRKRARLAHG